MIKTKKHLVQTANNFTYLGQSQSALRLASWQQKDEVMRLHTQKRMPWLLVKKPVYDRVPVVSRAVQTEVRLDS